MTDDRGLRQTRQCKSCPWRVDCEPGNDIPNGYSIELHEKLEACNAHNPGRIMACHHAAVGDEFACVGWLAHELGPGNNIWLRIRASQAKLGKLDLLGEQHECFEDTLP